MTRRSTFEALILSVATSYRTAAQIHEALEALTADPKLSPLATWNVLRRLEERGDLETTRDIITLTPPWGPTTEERKLFRARTR